VHIHFAAIFLLRFFEFYLSTAQCEQLPDSVLKSNDYRIKTGQVNKSDLKLQG
jgi:hypothetical protein